MTTKSKTTRTAVQTEQDKLQKTIIILVVAGLFLAAIVLISLDFRCGSDNPEPIPPDSPIAVITGPDESCAGDMVKLSSAGSIGLAFGWAVFPPEYESSFFTMDNGQTAIFASSKPGSVTFLFIAASGSRMSIATHTLKNGDAPEPGPGPGPGPNPPTPDDFKQLEKMTYDAVIRMVPSGNARNDIAKKLSISMGAIATEIGSGLLTTPKDVREQTRKRNREAIGTDVVKEWQEWADWLAKQLASLETANKLSSMSDYSKAWQAISNGLTRAASVSRMIRAPVAVGVQ